MNAPERLPLPDIQSIFDTRAVAIDDHRLTWPERELVRQLGEKLYGTAIGGRGMQR